VQALIAQKPADIGAQGVEQAVKALKGEETTPEIGTDFEVITKENLSEMQDVLYKPSC
jgi:ribose transport system substrate-binding protein